LITERKNENLLKRKINSKRKSNVDGNNPSTLKRIDAYKKDLEEE
jgi:hypothetical protein